MQVTLPEDLSVRLQQLSIQRRQSIEQIVADQLRMTLDDQLTQLPLAEQIELQALHYLSDDAVRVIAAEQMPKSFRQRMTQLMKRNSQATMTLEEREELTALVERGDQLMFRKAEAINLLRQRGYVVSIQDFAPAHA